MRNGFLDFYFILVCLIVAGIINIWRSLVMDRRMVRRKR